VAERRKALEQASTRLRTLCVETGVDDHAGAVAALAARRAATAELVRSGQRLAEALGRDTIGARARRIAGRAAGRRSPATPATVTEALEDAEHALEQAELAAARTRDHAEEMARRHEDATLRFQRCDRHRSDTRARLELSFASRCDLEQRLAAARE